MRAQWSLPKSLFHFQPARQVRTQCRIDVIISIPFCDLSRRKAMIEVIPMIQVVVSQRAQRGGAEWLQIAQYAASCPSLKTGLDERKAKGSEIKKTCC